MEIKTIKGINPEKWNKFKSLAAKNGLPMGKFFEIIIENYSKKEESSAWDKILNYGKILSDKEAKELGKVTKALRKERGFRNVLVH